VTARNQHPMGESDTNRQNGGMPYLLPSPEMPERVEAIRSAIGPAPSLAVLRFLLQNPGATRREIAESMGLSLPTARMALEALEKSGYVVADLPRSERVGRAVHYRIDRVTLVNDLGALTSWLVA